MACVFRISSACMPSKASRHVWPSRSRHFAANLRSMATSSTTSTVRPRLPASVMVGRGKVSKGGGRGDFRFRASHCRTHPYWLLQKPKHSIPVHSCAFLPVRGCNGTRRGGGGCAAQSWSGPPNCPGHDATPALARPPTRAHTTTGVAWGFGVRVGRSTQENMAHVAAAYDRA
jgi:hypothetical protein